MKNRFQTVALMLAAAGLALWAAPASAAESDCSACNSVNKVTECCRTKPGCTHQMAPTSTGAEGLNVCVSTRAAAPAKPAVKVSAKDCAKQYSACIGRVNARRSEFVSGKGKKRAGRASDWLDVAKKERAACQSRLKACRAALPL